MQISPFSFKKAEDPSLSKITTLIAVTIGIQTPFFLKSTITICPVKSHFTMGHWLALSKRITFLAKKVAAEHTAATLPKS